MKALAPVHPHKDSSGRSNWSLACLAEQNPNVALCEMDEDAAMCLRYDMNGCYSRLRRLVPTIPHGKKVSKVELLQHVIDYILDLQLALETHPGLLRNRMVTFASPRTPLMALNTQQFQAVSGAQNPEDSSFCPWNMTKWCAES